MADKMTAKQVVNCLRNRFAAPEWAFATELALVPGMSSRRADAVAMNCFMAGEFGCAILGFEIKVSRGDFLHELKQPDKRRETYAGVDALFLAVPAGLVDPFEVPNDLGLIVCKSDPETGSSARMVRKPQPWVMPGAAADRPHETIRGCTVRHAGMMPSLPRALAVAFLRSFDPDRRSRDLEIDKANFEHKRDQLKREARHRAQTLRDLFAVIQRTT